MTLKLVVPTLLLAMSVFSATSCSPDPIGTQKPVYQSDFSQDTDGWQTDYTDYSEIMEDINFESAWMGLPKPLDSTRRAVMISSINRSDDVFMFLTKKVTGLQPNRTYQLVFTIELASAYGNNSIGIGGSPGSSVFLKAGATAVEPKKRLNDGFYELNMDKGIQSEGGRDAIVLGNIGAGDDVTAYKLITRDNARAPFQARSNAQGELWLVVGTDSGFEGETRLYYSSIRVSLQ